MFGDSLAINSAQADLELKMRPSVHPSLPECCCHGCALQTISTVPGDVSTTPKVFFVPFLIHPFSWIPALLSVPRYQLPGFMESYRRYFLSCRRVNFFNSVIFFYCLRVLYLQMVCLIKSAWFPSVQFPPPLSAPSRFFLSTLSFVFKLTEPT